jgi:hypothetical protein
MVSFSDFPRPQLDTGTRRGKSSFAITARHMEDRSTALVTPTNRDDGESILEKHVVCAAVAVHHVSRRNRLKASRAIVSANRDAPASRRATGTFQRVGIATGRQHDDHTALARPSRRSPTAS